MEIRHVVFLLSGALSRGIPKTVGARATVFM
jgi:hypothetical protein